MRTDKVPMVVPPGEAEKILRPGDILFTRNKPGTQSVPLELISGLARKVQKSKLTHSGIYAGHGLCLEAAGDIDSTPQISATPLNKIEKETWWQAYRPQVAAPERREAVEFAKKQLGKPFNYLGVLKTFTKGDPGEDKEKARNRKSYFCSELVAAAYPQLVPGRAISHTRPVDFATSDKTKLVGSNISNIELAKLSSVERYVTRLTD